MKNMTLATVTLVLLSGGAALAQGMPEAVLQANQLHPRHAFIEPHGSSSNPFAWIGDLFNGDHSGDKGSAPVQTAEARTHKR